MATIYNNIDRVADEPKLGVNVKIDLVWDASTSPVALHIDEETMIQGSNGAQTDVEGYWEKDDIVPNDLISPAGSVYKITEELSNSNDVVYYISVPDNATPVFWTGGLIVSRPSYVNS